ncbi:thiolase family protein [Rhizobium sp. KVB221]|uniref:Thiolase family protein n=1 Tax=Rhizobium setariae TaxID=2801340 RepID=A0A936YRP5_9HYPH|nr:thiolase family protein [Rhizobium setariae]MBL0373361.1 thiolase family protein [Rhizobium setariae]
MMNRHRTSNRASYDGVAIAAPITVAYEKTSAKPAHWWIGRAIRGVIDQLGITPDAIDGLSVSSFTLGSDSAVSLTQHFGLSPRWLDHIPFGGASGLVALRRAARAVQSGDADIIVCVAGDTNQPGSFQNLLARFSRFSEDATYPYGAGGPNASFALLTDHYMRKYGATREDFGKLCVAQRHNAMAFPHALMKKPLSLEQYLAGRPISDPITLFDCVMPCAGAEAYAVMRAQTAAALGVRHARLLSAIERHNAYATDPIQERGGWAVDKDELWAMAGITVDDVDFVQTYDDYPVISMMQFEDLGFCAKGEGPGFVRSHSFTNTGSFPHNTSGGQLSVGQAGAAGGSLGLVEAVRQLTGAPLGAPVADAKIGLVSGFGMINYDRGLCSAAALLAAQDA